MWRALWLRTGVLRTWVAPIERMEAWRRLVSYYVAHDRRAARALASLVARVREPKGGELLPDDPLRRSVRTDAAWNLIVPPNWAAPTLLAALTGTGRPASADPARTLSLLALGRDPLSAEERGEAAEVEWTAAPEVVAEATRHGGHPLGEAARSYVLARADPALTDRVCRLALADPAPREPNLAWWCRGHGLSPADPLRRADFHLRVGDIDAYREADPDGSLLAVIYRGGDADGRFLLRQNLVASGAFDLLRTLPGAGDPFRLDVHAQTGHEEMVDLLVAAEDWPRLWNLVLDAPLDTAIAVSRRITGWKPPGADAAGLLRRFCDADADLVHRTSAALSRHRPYEIPQSRVIDPKRVVSGPLSIAPDGSKLVVADRGTGLIEVGTGEESPAVIHPVPGGRVVDVIHLGESIVALQGSSDRSRGERRGYRLVRYAPGRRARVLRTADQPSRLLRTPDGFVTLLPPDLLVFGTAAHKDGLRVVRLTEDRDPRYSSEEFLKASDADTGRILVCLPHPNEQWHHVVLVLDADGEVVARSAPDNRTSIDEAVFVGPDRIVSEGLTGWRIEDGTLIPQNGAVRYRRPYPHGPSLFPVAIHGVVGFLEKDELRFADASTLTPVANPCTEPEEYATLYFNRQADDSLRPPSGYHSEYWSSQGSSSPSQTYHQGDGRIAWRTTHYKRDGAVASPAQSTLTAYEPVLNVIGAMTQRGPGALADRTTIARARNLVPAGGDVAGVLDLLEARLAHRYDTEIALGTISGPPTTTGDDIAISPSVDDDAS
jgi:hypothetical protein